ncbi:unnamed protein product, partial [Amoebophrya sp. A120]
REVVSSGASLPQSGDARPVIFPMDLEGQEQKLVPETRRQNDALEEMEEHDIEDPEKQSGSGARGEMNREGRGTEDGENVEAGE